MSPVTGKQVQRAFKRQKIFSLVASQCDECGKNYHYVHVEPNLYKDYKCDCVREPSFRSIVPIAWDDMATTINRVRGGKKKEWATILNL